jgi:endonuclease YncB( thermonuclease family)
MVELEGWKTKIITIVCTRATNISAPRSPFPVPRSPFPTTLWLTQLFTQNIQLTSRFFSAQQVFAELKDTQLVHYFRFFTLLVFSLLAVPAIYADGSHGSSDNPKTAYIYGTVVGITDGDTLTILTAINKTAKIRLAEIDTPGRRQPYGKRAKQELSALTFQKLVAVKLVDIDRYQRIVGHIYADYLDVSAEIVRLGAAWVYR